MFGFGKAKGRAKVAPETLQEQIDALEGGFRSLKLEWTDTYDRLLRLAGRIDAGRRMPGEKTPPQGTGTVEKVPENGSDALPEQPAPEPAAPTTRMSRSGLLASWKT